MEMRDDLPDGYAIIIDDRANGIHYTVRRRLITQHAGDVITTSQSQRSPDWTRLPARYVVHFQTS